jgi:uncharacterized protein (DUF983 family)
MDIAPHRSLVQQASDFFASTKRISQPSLHSCCDPAISLARAVDFRPLQEAMKKATGSGDERTVRNLTHQGSDHRTLASTALRRGWRKRCPHCGEGRLFRGWAHHLERCEICGLVYERNPGDTWAFTVIGDRLPVAAIIALVYFGVVRSHPVPGVSLLAALGVLLVWTAPNRWGLGIALHYLSRAYWPDPDDPIPAPRV